ncbi:MAG: N-acetyltransferase family protein [Alphaproteobacteria bacterium]
MPNRLAAAELRSRSRPPERAILTGVQGVWLKFSWDLAGRAFEPRVPTGYTLRQARPDEVENVCRLALHSYRSDRIWDSIIAQIETRLGARIRATLGSPGTAYFVAAMGERLAGLSAASLAPHDGHHLITGVCVGREDQGRGLGRALLGACLDWLARNGLAQAQVYTDPAAMAARHVYPAFGAVCVEAPEYLAPEHGAPEKG